ncbi:MAG: hypothetical protein CMN97_00455 [Synechococcus sp. NAT40]|nr:hypothetical protein [Synechococcus sp. NAT40]
MLLRSIRVWGALTDAPYRCSQAPMKDEPSPLDEASDSVAAVFAFAAFSLCSFFGKRSAQ